MQWLTKLEEQINQILMRLMNTIQFIFWKLVPLAFLKMLWVKFKEWRNAELDETKEKITFKHKLIYVFNYLKKCLFSLSIWGKKQIIILNAIIRQNRLKTELRSIASKVLFYCQKEITNLLSWWRSIPTVIITMVIIGSGLLSIFSFVVYHNSAFIYQQIYPSEDQELSPDYSSFKRKPYYKLTERQMVIENLKMQVFAENVNSMKSLVMDLTLESSNRYIKSFFQKNDFYLQDRINQTMEPTIPEFPLTQEGKIIIRNKIIDECNNLLKEMNIEGRFTKVYFNTVIAG